MTLALEDHDAPQTREEGVTCPKCRSRLHRVIRTRHSGRYTRRKRECVHCLNQFWERAFVESEQPKPT